MIGRLNHAAYVLPQGRYFMNRMRHLLSKCKTMGPQSIPPGVRDDLLLWSTLLNRCSKDGISINNITFTTPTDITVSDACEVGMGGFNMSGLAWRYELPKSMHGKLTINLLEFIAASITVFLTMKATSQPQRVLAFTDSSSALGWMYKASFPIEQHTHDKVARWLALKSIDNNATLYSQHIKGSHNFIADSLSRDHHIDESVLTSAFLSLLPDQTPSNFRISTLPAEIISWIESLSRSSTRSPESLPPRSRSKLGALIDGESSWKKLELRMNGYPNSTRNKETIFCQRLQDLADEIATVKRENPHCLAKQLKPPSRMYVRHSGRIFGKTLP